MSVGFPASAKLTQWGIMVTQVFGGVCYQVGSSLNSKKWRDVDVVCIVEDDEFEKWAGTKEASYGEANLRWAGICIAFSEWGKAATGLNIDFKLQSKTWANERHKGPRSALIKVDIPHEARRKPVPLS